MQYNFCPVECCTNFYLQVFKVFYVAWSCQLSDVDCDVDLRSCCYIEGLKLNCVSHGIELFTLAVICFSL